MKKLLILCVVMALTGCTSLEKRHAQAGTPELKLRHSQIRESLGYDQNQPDIDFLKPIWMRGPGRAQRIKEKEAIERELLRRHSMGDVDAKLPMFP